MTKDDFYRTNTVDRKVAPSRNKSCMGEIQKPAEASLRPIFGADTIDFFHLLFPADALTRWWGRGQGPFQKILVVFSELVVTTAGACRSIGDGGGVIEWHCNNVSAFMKLGNAASECDSHFEQAFPHTLPFPGCWMQFGFPSMGIVRLPREISILCLVAWRNGDLGHRGIGSFGHTFCLRCSAEVCRMLTTDIV
ncbi:hypothetical protein CEXT_491671 [Caerostris extrusa]|uniref:Uncharacterized protein n=1 Tax=Caerostris extrusa TaxID=172846 RepID=A0AAV4U2R3_CAEEX|nr:hypothetical protein CEXT_491671 [Caerostris extrusa]